MPIRQSSQPIVQFEIVQISHERIDLRDANRWVMCHRRTDGGRAVSRADGNSVADWGGAGQGEFQRREGEPVAGIAMHDSVCYPIAMQRTTLLTSVLPNGSATGPMAGNRVLSPSATLGGGIPPNRIAFGDAARARTPHAFLGARASRPRWRCVFRGQDARAPRDARTPRGARTGMLTVHPSSFCWEKSAATGRFLRRISSRKSLA